MTERAQILLSLTTVSKSFPSVKALDAVTFDVRAGEVHGLVGENGAGKSTLMAVAAGALAIDEGRVEIAGVHAVGDPSLARQLGLAIVRQEPSLMPDLSVAENLYLALPREKRPPLSGLKRWADGLLARWSSDRSVRAGDRVSGLNPEQRFIVEIVKALSADPKVLVLDEPTEHLAAEDVARLFARIRALTDKGAAVVYISHRIREVQQISDRLTVLRDGQGQGTYLANELSEDRIVELIVGTTLDREFPAKSGTDTGPEILSVSGFTGHGFTDVSVKARRGEILGLAGIEANGQREFMRALVGLNRGRGRVVVNGRDIAISGASSAMQAGIAYLPGDRHREGIFAELSVKDNYTVRSLSEDAVGRVAISGASERRRAGKAVASFAVKTPTLGTPVQSLSGGNQQKVVLASVLASGPHVLLVDEPTQGVDVGARMEIYRVLREVAARGVVIIVVSSDAMEVAGLCDRVLVFSRGQVVRTLRGVEVTEANITSAVMTSTSVRGRVSATKNRFLTWAAGHSAPLVMMGVAIVLLATYADVKNPYYLTPRSLSDIMKLVGTLAFVGFGQQMLILIGGIDLSVGPLLGLTLVLGSFFLGDGSSLLMQVEGWAVILAGAAAVGLTNWVLVDPMRLHPMVATLATFMAVQAISLLLRPTPLGMISNDLMDAISTKVGGIPVTFAVAVALGLGLEVVLYRRSFGVALRGLGSRLEAARLAGVRPRRMRLAAYVGCSLLTAVAGVTLLEQVGIGDARAGLNYTLTSIAAVVIGGSSLFGGRGSFVGTLLGAFFIVQVNAVTTFLRLDQAWQSFLLGGMILIAVALYSKSRQLAVAA